MATSPLLNDPITLRINGKCWLLSFQDLCLDAYRTHNSFNKTFWRTHLSWDKLSNFPSKGGFTHNCCYLLLYHLSIPFRGCFRRVGSAKTTSGIVTHIDPSPHVDDVLCRPVSLHHDLDPGSRLSWQASLVLPVVPRAIMIFKKPSWRICKPIWTYI